MGKGITTLALCLFNFITTLSLPSTYDQISICDSIRPIDHKYIAIGDIHGSWETFQKILIAANITKDESCEWLPQSQSVTLIQMGDVVDRGAGATESWKCLDKLQETTPSNCQMIRLIGNHELMWLQGSFRDAHQADTKEKRLAIVDSLKRGILESKIVGSYVTTINHIPVMFIHAGFRPQMIDYISSTFNINPTPSELSMFVNEHVKSNIQTCLRSGLPCKLNTEIFAAGSERGGRNIGGPFWTDYQVLSKAAAEPGYLPNMIQIVGHTASPGNIRASQHLSAICIDSAMMYGYATYLEIGYDGRYKVFMHNEETNNWEKYDLISSYCKDS